MTKITIPAKTPEHAATETALESTDHIYVMQEREIVSLRRKLKWAKFEKSRLEGKLVAETEKRDAVLLEQAEHIRWQGKRWRAWRWACLALAIIAAVGVAT